MRERSVEEELALMKLRVKELEAELQKEKNRWRVPGWAQKLRRQLGGDQ